MSTLPELISLPISPWSERAKWALDHHRVKYEVVIHVPVLGERKLRRIVGPNKPRATTPVLVVDGEVLSDSWDIALYADRVGHGDKLARQADRPAIERWIATAEKAMDAGRLINVAALLKNDAALDEAATIAPRWVRPLMRPMTRRFTRAFGRKYADGYADDTARERAIRAGLDELRKGLAGRAYLLDKFSFADIAMASLVQGVMPVADEYVRLGPATRSIWTKTAIAKDYPDLIEWRDGLYARHR